MPRKLTVLLLLTILILSLAACQPAPTATTEPTTAADPATVAYPVVTEAASVPTEAAADVAGQPAGDLPAATAYPGGEVNIVPTAASEGLLGSDYPAPNAMPAVENRSAVTARLVEQAPDDSDPANTRLTVEVLASSPIENMPDFTSQLIGQTVDLFTVAADMPELNPDDTFEAEVSYQGDENGGRFFARNIVKQP